MNKTYFFLLHHYAPTHNSINWEPQKSSDYVTQKKKKKKKK